LQRARTRGETDARVLLHDWSGSLGADSAPAALFEVWWTKHLKPALFAAIAPDIEARKLLAPGDVESILRLIEAPDHRLGLDPITSRDRILVETLDAAYRECMIRMGEDPAAWSWGRLHQAYFQHPLSSLCQNSRLDVGPLAKGGSGSTPMHAGYRSSDFRVIAGASVRIIMDVGDWNQSVCVNAPGQSGDPRSPHYADLAVHWARGEYVPLLYTRDRIDEAATIRIALVPAVTDPDAEERDL
jgi:penicillin amidase